ncbi:uncharacterized protein LOC112555662 [Pomacea canaliculata]|uniref:uncharacterized protein LOC112555662 n=1 Tax=Pomacea canaliculata TaxID=400727 RepID=UPI000D731320|nr:uncharacterized protein LOC112555662 [Pomacea canaliculata]
MYCVLPLMVLVYGGCSVIYCVYKLRKYIRRRKHKRFQNEDDSGSFTGNSSTNLLQNGDHYNAREKEGVKTVSGGTWLDDSSFSDVRYEETKKSPLPWDTPHKIAPTAGKRPESRQDQKIESFILSDRNDRNSGTLEREREKLDEKVNNQEKKQEDRVEAFMREKKLEEIRSDQRREGMEPVKPVHKGSGLQPSGG